MSESKAITSVPPSPAQNNQRGNQRKVAEQAELPISSDDDTYPIPNTSGDVRAKDIPNPKKAGRPAGKGGKRPQERPTTPKTSTSKKGKNRQGYDSGEYEAPVLDISFRSSSLEPTSEPPKPKRKAANQNQGEISKAATSEATTSKATTTKKGANDTDQGKPESEYGTMEQGLHWIVYSGRAHLDSMADFEEICTYRAHSERAQWRAKEKAHKAEERIKELDLKIAESHRLRLQNLSDEAILLDFRSQLAAKDEEIAKLQEQVARANIRASEQEQAAEAEKIKRLNMEIDCAAIQERVLREEYALLVAKA